MTAIVPWASTQAAQAGFPSQHTLKRDMPSTVHQSLPPDDQNESSAESESPTVTRTYDTPIPKEINYIWLGQTFENFDQNSLRDCVKNNPDHHIRLWLDDFSMLETEGPRGLPRVLPAASLKLYTSGTNKTISSADIKTTFAMMVRAQMEYYKIAISGTLRAEIPTIQKFQHFLQEDAFHHVEVHFLSNFYETLFHAEHLTNPNSFNYPSLQSSSSTSQMEYLGPQIKLLQWAFFERCRGNYAAASNLLRVQLLQTYPGIYVDHHTIVPPIGDLTGFRFALTADLTASQTFLASAPKHPCLQYFRYCILQNYDALSKRDFKCVTLDYTTMKKPTDPTDVQNPWFTEVYSMSGAGAFFRAMKDVAEGGLGGKVDISGAAMEGVKTAQWENRLLHTGGTASSREHSK
ncbi:nucleotide-diphospho-sugar transferase [Usnea florida]